MSWECYKVHGEYFSRIMRKRKLTDGQSWTWTSSLETQTIDWLTLLLSLLLQLLSLPSPLSLIDVDDILAIDYVTPSLPLSFHTCTHPPFCSFTSNEKKTYNLYYDYQYLAKCQSLYLLLFLIIYIGGDETILCTICILPPGFLFIPMEHMFYEKKKNLYYDDIVRFLHAILFSGQNKCPTLWKKSSKHFLSS